MIFVNGMPLGVIELKNPADENATIWSAFRQLQTYGAQIARREEPLADLELVFGCYADPLNHSWRVETRK